MQGKSKLDNPCKDCRYRSVACHGNCFLYKEWKSQITIARELAYKQRARERALDEAINGLNPRNRKRHKKII